MKKTNLFRTLFLLVFVLLDFDVYTESIDIKLPYLIPENMKGRDAVQTKLKDQLIQDFTKYSGYTVVDSGKLSEVLSRQKESETAVYGNALDVGEVIAAEYFVDVNIFYTDGKYSLSARVTDSRTNEIKGGFSSDDYSYEDFLNKVHGEVSIALLNAMGVKLSENDKYYLRGGKTAEETYLDKPEEVKRAEKARRWAEKNSKEYQADFPDDAIKLGGGILISPNYKGWNVNAFADVFWLFENPLGLKLGPKYMLTSSFQKEFGINSILLQLEYERKIAERFAIYGFVSGGVGFFKTGAVLAKAVSGYDVYGEDVKQVGFCGQLGLGVEFAVAAYVKLFAEYSFNYLSPKVGTGDIVSIGVSFGPRQ